MNLPNLNLRVFLILVALLTIILIVLLAFYFARQKNSTLQPMSNLPTPTLIKPNSGVTPYTEDPEAIVPTGFTGVKDEELPPDELALAIQKQELKSNLPVSESLFDIDFDYAEDKFIVTLKEPKNQAQASFEEWLSDNYPAIPLDRFILR